MQFPPATTTPAPVWILAPDGSLLGAALQAALGRLGWPAQLGVHCQLGWTAERGRSPACRSLRVLLVEDNDGRPSRPYDRSRPDDRAASGLRVCIGSLRSVEALIPLVRRGAVPLNQDGSLPDLTRGVLDALARPGPLLPAEAARSIAALERRRDEAEALARLTPSEARVLDLLIAGHTAARIAERTARSEHTVRSQIRSLLAKLDVSSQLVAVALAHRSGYRAAANAWAITHFGEDQAPWGERR